MKCEFDEFLLRYCKDVASLISNRVVPHRGSLVGIRMTNVDWVKYSSFVRTTFIRNCVSAILQRALYQWCPIVSVAIRTSEGFYVFPRKNDQFTRGISGLKSFLADQHNIPGFYLHRHIHFSHIPGCKLYDEIGSRPSATDSTQRNPTGPSYLRAISARP